jgi:Lrp/AsnC family leucine-responsive transcriptional regulator
MALGEKAKLDAIDWAILTALQEDPRISFAELGRRVHLTAPAAATRVRRLQDLRIIRGFHVDLGLEELGLTVLAFVRVRAEGSRRRGFLEAAEARQEVLECHHVTGDDCFWVKVAARSTSHLNELVEDLGRYGATTTSIVFESPVAHRTLVLSDRRARRATG